MVTFLEAVTEEIRLARCLILGAGQLISRGLNNLPPASEDDGTRVFTAARRLYGCLPEEDTQPTPPPFTGGQCPKRYRVNFTVQTGSSCADLVGFPVTQNVELWGPILGTYTDPNTCPPGGAERGPVGIRAFSVAGGNRLGSPVKAQLNGSASSITINSVEVIFSGAGVSLEDDCGDPPPELPPETTFDTDIDVTYNIDDGTEVTVTVPFVFAPFTVDFNGDVKFPFTFDFGGFEFSGDVNLSADFKPTINFPRYNPGDADPITDTVGDDDGPSTPPAPPTEKIIGVVVNAAIVQSGKVSEYSSPNIPPIFVPRLGSVKFVYSLGAATFFSSDIDIKDARTFIECPFSQGADAVIASPQEGVSMTFVPIRGFPLATTGDLARLG